MLFFNLIFLPLFFYHGEPKTSSQWPLTFDSDGRMPKDRSDAFPHFSSLRAVRSPRSQFIFYYFSAVSPILEPLLQFISAHPQRVLHKQYFVSRSALSAVFWETSSRHAASSSSGKRTLLHQLQVEKTVHVSVEATNLGTLSIIISNHFKHCTSVQGEQRHWHCCTCFPNM